MEEDGEEKVDEWEDDENEIEEEHEHEEEVEDDEQGGQDEGDDDVCAMCGAMQGEDPVKDHMWIACDTCNLWMHSACAGEYGGKRLTRVIFRCIVPALVSRGKGLDTCSWWMRCVSAAKHWGPRHVRLVEA